MEGFITLVSVPIYVANPEMPKVTFTYDIEKPLTLDKVAEALYEHAEELEEKHDEIR